MAKRTFTLDEVHTALVGYLEEGQIRLILDDLRGILWCTECGRRIDLNGMYYAIGKVQYHANCGPNPIPMAKQRECLQRANKAKEE